ncbi:MAG: hypothetical protein M1817_001477 [Caeruleum heppii]|nr:MAG: hypothetical protein M1817_001477 [Caeruleum heppii]
MRFFHFFALALPLAAASAAPNPSPEPLPDTSPNETTLLESRENHLMKRDDCHGSGLCRKGHGDRAKRLWDLYADQVIYNAYTSFAWDGYTAMYLCEEGYNYPQTRTGKEIREAAAIIHRGKGEGGLGCRTCGTHWMTAEGGELKCRVTSNACGTCTMWRNGNQIGTAP